MHGTMIVAEENLKIWNPQFLLPIDATGVDCWRKFLSELTCLISFTYLLLPQHQILAAFSVSGVFDVAVLLSVCKCCTKLSSKRYQFRTGTMLNEDNHTIMGALWLRCLHRIWICPFMVHVWVWMGMYDCMYGCMYGAMLCGYWVLHVTFCTMEVGSSNLVYNSLREV